MVNDTIKFIESTRAALLTQLQAHPLYAVIRAMHPEHSDQQTCFAVLFLMLVMRVAELHDLVDECLYDASAATISAEVDALHLQLITLLKERHNANPSSDNLSS